MESSKSSKAQISNSIILRDLDESISKIVKITTFLTVDENSFFYFNSILLNTSEEIYPVLYSRLFSQLNYSLPSNSIPIPTKNIKSTNLHHVQTYLRFLLGLLSESKFAAISGSSPVDITHNTGNKSPTTSLFNFLEPFKPTQSAIPMSRRSSFGNASINSTTHKSSPLSSSNTISADEALQQSHKNPIKKRFSKFNIINSTRNNISSLSVSESSKNASTGGKTSLLNFSTSSVQKRMALLQLTEESDTSTKRNISAQSPNLSAAVSSSSNIGYKKGRNDSHSSTAVYSPTRLSIFNANDNSDSPQSGFDNSSVFSNSCDTKESITVYSNNSSSGSSNSLVTASSKYGNSISSNNLTSCNYLNSKEFKDAINTFLMYLKSYYKTLKALINLFSSVKLNSKDKIVKDLYTSSAHLLNKLNREVLDKFFKIVNEVAAGKARQSFDSLMSEHIDDSDIFLTPTD